MQPQHSPSKDKLHVINGFQDKVGIRISMDNAIKSVKPNQGSNKTGVINIFLHKSIIFATSSMVK